MEVLFYRDCRSINNVSERENESVCISVSAKERESEKHSSLIIRVSREK